MSTSQGAVPQPHAGRADLPDPAQSQINPLLRLHLLLYGHYKWAIALGLLLSAIGATAVWNLLPPKYEVIGYIRVKPYIPPVLSQTDQNGVLPMFETFVSLQVSLLQSQRVLDQASGNPDWTALGRNSPRWGHKIPADALTVDHPKGSEVVTVGFTERDPKVAAIAVKSILQAYETTSGDTDSANDTHRLQVLEDLRTSLTNQKRVIGEQILALATEFGSDDLQSRYQFKLEEQNKLEAELQQVALDISIAQAAGGSQPAANTPSTQAAAQPATQPAAVAPVSRQDIAKTDSQMRDDLATESRLSLRLSQLRQRLGDSHPEVVAAQSDLQDIENQINSLVTTYQERATAAGPAVVAMGNGLRLSLPELHARETNIRSLFETVQTETKALGQQDLKIRKLKADQDAISHKLDETAARIDQLNLESTTSNRISIMSYGESPTAPLPSKRLPLTVAVGLMGLAAGAGLVALRGLADSRVSSLLHMQKLAPTIRTLGTLPVLPDDLAAPEQISLAAHCVHQIRGLLETAPAQNKARVLAVTSPSAGDGKTSLTLALGLSFAASGSRTLLIDCDMVGGGLTSRLNAVAHRRLGRILSAQNLLSETQLTEALEIARTTRKKLGEVLVDLGHVKASDIQQALADQKKLSTGILDALNGEPLDGCITKVLMKGLYILPRGDAGPHSSNQISAKTLRRIIRQTRSCFEFIILDTGPLLGSLEASVAAREADEVVLAIARGAPWPLVTRTVDLLGSLGARLEGVVFNRATPADVAYSHHGSSGSLRSYHTPANQSHPAEEPQISAGSPPRLGPLAAAVATSGGGRLKKAAPTPVLNGSSKKSDANGHSVS